MDKSDLEQHVGKVVVLDLITGLQITTELKRLYSSKPLTSPDEDMAELGKIYVFQLSHILKDPRLPPSPDNVAEKVDAIPYGGPFVMARDTYPIELSHILFAWEPLASVEKAYMSKSSGIQVAGADALNNLKDVK